MLIKIVVGAVTFISFTVGYIVGSYLMFSSIKRKFDKGEQ